MRSLVPCSHNAVCRWLWPSDVQYRLTVDVDSPRLTRRVEWGFDPAQVTFLIFIVEIDDVSIFGFFSHIYVDSTVGTHVSSSDSDALRLKVHESLVIRDEWANVRLSHVQDSPRKRRPNRMHT